MEPSQPLLSVIDADGETNGFDPGLGEDELIHCYRTMLAVPNSVFSAVEVENFSQRDRIRYYQHIELQMATADQLRVILARLREIFLAHADVMQSTVSIRLQKVAAATAVIRIDAGVENRDVDPSSGKAECMRDRSTDDPAAPGQVRMNLTVEVDRDDLGVPQQRVDRLAVGAAVPGLRRLVSPGTRPIRRRRLVAAVELLAARGLVALARR